MATAGVDRALAIAEIALALPTFLALRTMTAPYGRHVRGGWGPGLPARIGWLLMESPAVIVFAAAFATGARRAEPAPMAFLAMWELHYVHRAFVYPLRIARAATRIPLGVVSMAVAFNVLNGWLNGQWVSAVQAYPAGWLTGPRFLAGASLFAAGLVLNVTSDNALRRLRALAGRGYRIPRGGAFEWISCPNYLGEIVEWVGWAIATWSLAGLAFALYTTANLAPRALAHHAWYRRTFPDYPRQRRALVPLVW